MIKHEQSSVDSFLVSNDYLITSSNEEISLYSQDTLELCGSIKCKLYSTIVLMNKDNFIVSEGSSCFTSTYDLQKKQLYDLSYSNLWIVHYAGEKYIYLKTLEDGDRQTFSIIKYDFQENREIWKTNCSNYKLFLITPEYVIVDAGFKRFLECFYGNSGLLSWKIDLSSISSEIFKGPLDGWELYLSPKFYKDILIIQTLRIKPSTSLLIALNIRTGETIWHQTGINNFQLFEGKIYNLEFDGRFSKLDAETGEIEQENNLSIQFMNFDIECQHSFTVTKTHIYFKEGNRGKFAILNIATLNIEAVYQLPNRNIITMDDLPIPIGNRIFIRSSQNNLFVYER